MPVLPIAASAARESQGAQSWRFSRLPADYHTLADNDIYGHINNVEYYAFFDTVVNAHLIERGVLDIHGSATVGLVVETKCNFFTPLAFPDLLEGGLRVDRIGKSSVQYGVAIFREGAVIAAAATGDSKFTCV